MDRRFASLLVLAAMALPTGLIGVAALAPAAEARSTTAARSTQPVVEDVEGLLPDGRADALRKRLAKVPADGLVVVLTRRAEAGGIERQAEDAFQAQRLGPRALSVAIAIDDRKVAVHVGQDLRRRGIDREVITAAIGEHFKAHARAGNYDDGAFALADAVARHPGRPAARDGARPTAPAAAEPKMGVGEAFGWLLFGAFLTFGLPLLLIGGVVWFIWRMMRRGEAKKVQGRTRTRIDALERARDEVMTGVVALDGAIALARGAAEDPSQATATAVMAEAQAFTARVEAVGKAFPASDAAEEEEEVAALEMTALNLEVSIATLRTAYQDGSHDAFRDALKLGRRWKLVDAQVAWLVEQNRGKAKKRAVLTDLVAKARQALTAVPIDLAHATELISEAETTLEAMGITKIEEQPATSATSRVPASSSHHHLDYWDVTPVHVCLAAHAVHEASHSHSHGHSHHDDHHASSHSDSSSGSSWWGSSSSDSSSSGSSSWGSSSDDDSNRWSSSDSGSSSWDSGSSSSDSSSSSSGSDSW